MYFHFYNDDSIPNSFIPPYIKNTDAINRLLFPIKMDKRRNFLARVKLLGNISDIKMFLWDHFSLSKIYTNTLSSYDNVTYCITHSITHTFHDVNLSAVCYYNSYDIHVMEISNINTFQNIQIQSMN